MNCLRRLAVCVALSIVSMNGLGAERPPNVIVVLVDDLGWKDVTCQGSESSQTPHVDQLASRGVRFTAAYAACTVCSPTRAAMMTGQYPARLHVTDWIAGHERPHALLRIPDWRKHLPAEAVTVAERLSGAGYATALIGKWHLGEGAFSPEHRGFDHNVGGCQIGHPPSYFSPYRIPALVDGPTGEYLTDREASEAVAFVESHRDVPFYLHLAHYAVHTPIQAKPEATARAVARWPNLSPQRAAYAAMIESVDESLGRILTTLDRLGLRDQTAIVFTSDNGGQASITDMKPLRAGKGSAYEGGVRVPLVITWPGVTSAGTQCDEPVITPDIPATILDLTHVGTVADQPLDGCSLAPLFEGGTLGRDAIFWHYPHYHPGGATPYSAVRAGPWRLVHFYEDGRDELYHLGDDPGESRDLAGARPDQTSSLRARLDQWLSDVGAQLPTPNPEADSTRHAR